ncbi:MAG: peptidase M16 [Bacteroidetes bacterium 4572_77]|nr:MAG: peptidase M16 [Bacteroidetes bacterium 4572_77]
MEFKRFKLKNGLSVIVHHDKSTPMVAVNILYKVGARNETPERTGFAHLFEHLMFGGSANIPDFDGPLENAGGDNNAFTNSDITNYYITIPKENLETAFWLESDRMLNLAFTPKSLEVQRQVVIEEFKQSYLNQPYGDVWLLLKPLAYKTHPYQWNTIGKDISHIEKASMEEVKAFYQKFYNPNNAIMVLSGNISAEEAEPLVEKWFGDIPKGADYTLDIPQEPLQTTSRQQSVERDVPSDALYMAFPMYPRLHADYQATDLLSDVLSNGSSARLNRRLIKEQAIFSELDAFLSGDKDAGLFLFQGKPSEGISLEQAEKALWKEIELIKTETIASEELQKVKNKLESTMIFGEVSVLNKAMQLAYYEFIDTAENVNMEAEKYQQVSAQQIQRIAQELFVPEKSNTLYYRSNKQQ